MYKENFLRWRDWNCAIRTHSEKSFYIFIHHYILLNAALKGKLSVTLKLSLGTMYISLSLPNSKRALFFSLKKICGPPHRQGVNSTTSGIIHKIQTIWREGEINSYWQYLLHLNTDRYSCIIRESNRFCKVQCPHTKLTTLAYSKYFAKDSLNTVINKLKSARNFTSKAYHFKCATNCSQNSPNFKLSNISKPITSIEALRSIQHQNNPLFPHFDSLKCPGYAVWFSGGRGFPVCTTWPLMHQSMTISWMRAFRGKSRYDDDIRG